MVIKNESDILETDSVKDLNKNVTESSNLTPVKVSSDSPASNALRELRKSYFDKPTTSESKHVEAEQDAKNEKLSS